MFGNVFHILRAYYLRNHDPECEELKDGVWVEQLQALVKSTTNDRWTTKNVNVARKLIVGSCLAT